MREFLFLVGCNGAGGSFGMLGGRQGVKWEYLALKTVFVVARRSVAMGCAE